MKLRYTIFAATLLAASVLTLSCCGLLPEPFPSDRKMEAKFNKYEADFTRLVSMFKEDSAIDSVWPDSASATSPNTVPNRVEVELPKERQNEYRTLFKRLGLSYMYRSNNGMITMKAWESGGFSYSETKYYVYAESPPSPLVSSLEESSSSEDVSEYKHIRGNWYLHYTKF